MDYSLTALSQSPVIIQQTLNWLAVIIGATATLGGAALGAWLGARGAYVATKKASLDLTRQSKLEKALAVIKEAKAEASLHLATLHMMLERFGLSSAQEVAENGVMHNVRQKVYQLEVLIALHAPDSQVHIKKLIDSITSVRTSEGKLLASHYMSEDEIVRHVQQLQELNHDIAQHADDIWKSLYPLARTD